MRKEEKAALDVLAKASDVHNCWAILDEAVTSGEDDQFTEEYIEGEREMLEDSIKGAIRALGTLGGLYGIVANIQNDNGSYAYMRKVRDEHLTELERAKEFDRGYQAGKQAMDAERRAIALRLRGLDLTGSSHENLSKMAYAIYPCATGWTAESCEGLRDELVRLLGGVNERETALTTYDALDNERHKAICELRKITIDSYCYGNYQRIALAIGATYDGKRFASECVRDRLIHLLGGDQPSGIDVLRESCKNGDNCKTEASESVESSKYRENYKSGCITDELREFKGHINAKLTPEMVLALRAEINGIADRIEEQFNRICWQQEKVLQQTIDEMVDERDELKAKLDEIAEVLDGRD